MTSDVFTLADLEQMNQLEISEDEARKQVAIFERGSPRLTLRRPCTLGDGTVDLEAEAEDC